MINLSVSIFGQITGYRIYIVSREPIRLLKIQYPVFVVVVVVFKVVHVLDEMSQKTLGPFGFTKKILHNSSSYLFL